MKFSILRNFIFWVFLSYAGNATAAQNQPAFEVKQEDGRTIVTFVKTGKSMTLTDKVVKEITSMEQVEELGDAKVETKTRFKEKEGVKRDVAIYRQATPDEKLGVLRIDTMVWDDDGIEGGEVALNRTDLYDISGKKLTSFQSARGYIEILNREGYFYLTDEGSTNGKVTILMTPSGKEVKSFEFIAGILPSVSGKWVYVSNPLKGLEYLVELHTGKILKGSFEHPKWRVSRAELGDDKTIVFKGGSRRKVFTSKFVEE